MLRYKLRTLLIVLALGPPVLAWGWGRYSAWRVEQERLAMWREYPDTGLEIEQAQSRVNLNYHGELPERMLNGLPMPRQ